jgi:hypothetical protein
MKKFNYSLPTSSTFCASFDYGFVWAKDADEAREKAIHELNYNVEKVNSILNHSDNTNGFSIEICTDELLVEETDESLVNLVIQQIKQDIASGDTTAVIELLKNLSIGDLANFLPETSELFD